MWFRKSSSSLRARLLWLVLAIIAVASAVQGATIYRMALREADKMFDTHLREVARTLSGSGPLSLPDMDPQYSVRIWGPDGTELYRSNRAQLPSQAVIGFSDAHVNGVRMRIYSLQTPWRTVQIAQDLDAREARAGEIAAAAVTPVLLIAPALMLAAGLAIDRALRPLKRIRGDVAARSPTDLSPLAGDDAPDEVRPLIVELNGLFERVRETLESQERFVADAAHELRSPLTALKLQVEAAQRSGDAAARERALQQLAQGIERSITLVEQLLALAREQSGAHTGPQPVDLEAIARDIVGELLPRAQARGQELAFTAAQPFTALADRDGLAVILRNLVDNAIKYTPEGGTVEIVARQEDGRAIVAVEDSGPGIPEAEEDRVRDRFYRLPDATAPGSGLGLAIVDTVARRLGTQLKLGRSGRLGGLEASIELPLANG